jgi:polar amino acid transport system substrate-binding protein
MPPIKVIRENQHMKRFFFVICLFLFIFFSSNLFAGDLTAVVSGHPEYPPIMWKQNDKITGAGVELIKLVFVPLGVNIKSVYSGDWSAAQQDLKSGKIDALVGVYMTDERKPYMDFTAAYTKDPVVIFVSKGRAFPFEKPEDLIGRKGVSTTGDSFGQAIDAFIASELDVKRSVTVKENFDRLISSEADYFIFAMYSGIFESKKLGIYDKVEYLKKYAAVENFYFGISKNSRLVPLIPKANKRIEKLVKDGTVDKLIKKYSMIYEHDVLKLK